MKGLGPKNETKAGMELVVRGMPVSVSGVVAKWSDDGQYLYTNTGGITPLRDGVVPSRAVRDIIEHFEQPPVAAASAVRLSLTMRGFFNQTYPPAHEAQAAWFRAQFVSARDGMAAACATKAMALRAERGNDDNDAGILDAHSARLSQTNPADLAFRTNFFAAFCNSFPTPLRALSFEGNELLVEGWECSDLR